MALCLNCGNDNLETILLSQSSCSPDGLDWPDINILDAIYEPFYALYADDNMPRKTTDTKSSGKPRAPLAVSCSVAYTYSTLLTLRSVKDVGNERLNVVAKLQMEQHVRAAEVETPRASAISGE